MTPSDSSVVSRRALLSASAGVLAVSAGTGRVSAGTDRSTAIDGSRWLGRCPDATIKPSMGHCDGASMDGCADDHPETRELREAVRETLEERYPTVGALIDDGFLPYFDSLDRDEGGWSHWLSPDNIDDDGILDPDRPESVLVDNERWEPIGVMFIATRDGETVDPPPAVYEDGDAGEVEDEDDSEGSERDEGDGSDGERGHKDHGDPTRCSPWHYHAGLPGRLAWWYYQEVYANEHEDGSRPLPCRTPCMLHVWTVEHPDGVYAHGGPPAEYREGPEADDAGFETDAEPDDDELGWDVLPDELVPDRLPGDVGLP